MASKFFTAALLLLTLSTSLPARAGDPAFKPIGHPLGIVVRPQLLQKLTNLIAGPMKSQSAQEGYEIPSFCFQGHEFFLRLRAKAVTQEWGPFSGNELTIAFRFEDFLLVGHALEGCKGENRKSLPEFSINFPGAKDGIEELSVRISPMLFVRAEPEPKAKDQASSFEVLSMDRVRLAQHLNISSTRWAGIADLLKSDDLKTKFISSGIEKAQQMVSTWIYERFRGLRYESSVAAMLGGENVLWKKGPLVESGAMTLEFAEPSKNFGDLQFVILPYSGPFAFADKDALELYTFVSFLNPQQVQRTRSIDMDLVRPLVPRTNHDLAFVIPTALINSALDNIYRQGLLRFITRIATGRETKGKISDQVQNTEEVIRLASQSAPRIEITPEPGADPTHSKLKLRISDYVVTISSRVEDRVVPHTALRINAEVAAKLELSSDNSWVVLTLSPDTFNVDLEDVSKDSVRLVQFPTQPVDPRDLTFFKKVAKSLWQNYLGLYPQLELFKAAITLQGFRMDVADVNTYGDTIVLPLDFKSFTPELAPPASPEKKMESKK